MLVHQVLSFIPLLATRAGTPPTRGGTHRKAAVMPAYTTASKMAEVTEAVATAVATLLPGDGWAQRDYTERKWYRKVDGADIFFKKGKYTDHRDATVRAAVYAIRTETGASYRELAAAMGFQCDHWSQAAMYQEGKDKDGWQAMTGGFAAKLAKEADAPAAVA